MSKILTRPQFYVIQLSGSLNAANAGEFHQQLTEAVEQERQTPVIVDMEQVESLDSAGLMALVHGLRLAQALGHRFSICGVSPAVRIIFELTQLDQVFEMFDSRAEFEATLA